MAVSINTEREEEGRRERFNGDRLFEPECAGTSGIQRRSCTYLQSFKDLNYSLTEL